MSNWSCFAPDGVKSSDSCPDVKLPIGWLPVDLADRPQSRYDLLKISFGQGALSVAADLNHGGNFGQHTLLVLPGGRKWRAAGIDAILGKT